MVKKKRKKRKSKKKKKKQIRWDNVTVDYPKIFLDWHPVLNGTKAPNRFKKKHSKQKVWWLCHNKKCKHVWKDTFYSRIVLKKGCPKCEERERNRKKPDRAKIQETIQQMNKVFENLENTIEQFLNTEMSNWKALKTIIKIRKHIKQYNDLNKKMRMRIIFQHKSKTLNKEQTHKLLEEYEKKQQK